MLYKDKILRLQRTVLKRSIAYLVCASIVISMLLFCSNSIRAYANTTTYTYKGTVETFTVPSTGDYKIELYGAAGGSQEVAGGKGAYVSVEVILTKGNVLYICVGGKGVKTTSTGSYNGWVPTVGAGGYNGGAGGSSYGHQDGWSYVWHTFHQAGGGGATHVALGTNLGVLANYSSNTAPLIAVAGGGGGATDNNEPRENDNGDASYDHVGGDGGINHSDDTPFGQAISTGENYPWHGGGGGGYKSGLSANLYDKIPATGGTSYTSSACKNVTKTAGINAGDGKVIITALHVHSYTPKVTTEATCTTKGVKTFTCACGDKYTEDIDALGHDKATTWTYDKTNHWKTCSRCTAIFDKTTHTKTSTVSLAATCTAKGKTKYGCSVCTWTETLEDIPALGHLPDSTYTYKTQDGVANGCKQLFCQRCKIALETYYLQSISVKRQNVDSKYSEIDSLSEYIKVY